MGGAQGEERGGEWWRREVEARPDAAEWVICMILMWGNFPQRYHGCQHCMGSKAVQWVAAEQLGLDTGRPCPYTPIQFGVRFEFRVVQKQSIVLYDSNMLGRCLRV